MSVTQNEAIDYVILSIDVVRKFSINKFEILKSLFKEKDLDIDEKFFTDILTASKLYQQIEDKYTTQYANHFLAMIKMMLICPVISETLKPVYFKLEDIKELYDHIVTLVNNLL